MSAAPLLDGIGPGAAVLVVGTPRYEVPTEVKRHEIDAPATVGVLRGALATPREPELFDAALIHDWGRDVLLTELVEATRHAVRDEGRIAFVAPIARAGWRGARGALIGVLRGRRPIPLEDLCGALLLGGCVDVRARDIEDAAGLSMVWARVPSGTREDVESSSIRSTGNGSAL